ncbi:cyclin-dependent kinases regulatory subunit-like [Lineus longissimus]|uniref:cyclin-dependent kinases regulatory subunit-like n=1 Tax=Lineus longissimus TaxID=88925 RepID=UPI002B4CE4BB
MTSVPVLIPTCICIKMSEIQYSEKYFDELYEYRHVIVPKDIAKQVPKNHLMTETEWRNIGLRQSPGWMHYLVHAPEPHVLLFRRLLPKTQIELPVALHSKLVTNL